MKKLLLVPVIILVFISCKSKDAKKGFEVSGTITNNTANMIYLEAIPMATMQPVVVDSATVGKDGKFILGTDRGESSVFNLRLDQSGYPFAAVINDTSKVTVDVTFNKENKEFPEKYEVKGSTASTQMKDFMFAFNSQLQAIFMNDTKADSLQRSGAADTVLSQLRANRANIALAARTTVDDAIQKSTNPALTMFILGYYQSVANNPAYQLASLDNEEVKAIVDDLANRFPDHTGLASIRKTLKGWVGEMAPEISMTDPNGKTISLSSYKGKYVLVDFWASWCKPCRIENPNVVKAWNRFKGKNFSILGVSLDMEGQKDKWVKAIMEDKLTWDHVSDLKYWNSEVVPLYNINGIPYNVLVDPDGKIIAEKLFGEELERKLAEVLK